MLCPCQKLVGNRDIQIVTYWCMQQVLSIDILQNLLQARRIWFEEEEFTPETLSVLLALNILKRINIVPIVMKRPNAIP